MSELTVENSISKFLDKTNNILWVNYHAKISHTTSAFMRFITAKHRPSNIDRANKKLQVNIPSEEYVRHEIDGWMTHENAENIINFVYPSYSKGDDGLYSHIYKKYLTPEKIKSNTDNLDLFNVNIALNPNNTQEVLGFIITNHTKVSTESNYLEYIVVNPELQTSKCLKDGTCSRKVGSSLLKSLITPNVAKFLLMEDNPKRIVTYVRKNNKTAQKLFSKYNFKNYEQKNTITDDIGNPYRCFYNTMYIDLNGKGK